MSAVPTTPRASRVSLSTVTPSRGGVPKALSLVVHGDPKVGKSTFAAMAPRPVFIPIDDGLGELEAQAFPVPRTFGDVLGIVQALTVDDHDFQTLVVDHASVLEPLIWDVVCNKNGWLNIETPPFRKGYHAAIDEWRDLFSSLDRLRAKRGMHTILIAQSAHVLVKPKDKPEHTQAMLAVNQLAAGQMRSWCNCILYADTETDALGEVTHVLRTTLDARWHAGNRLALPPTMPLDASLFWREVAEAQVPVEELIERARSLAAELGKETVAEVEIALRNANRQPWELLVICRRVRTQIETFFRENSR